MKQKQTLYTITSMDSAAKVVCQRFFDSCRPLAVEIVASPDVTDPWTESTWILARKLGSPLRLCDGKDKSSG